MGTRHRSRHQQQQKNQHRHQPMTVAHHLEAQAGHPSTWTASSLAPTCSSSFVTRRRRTFRVGGLVSVTTALQAGGVLIALFYFFSGALLFCVLTLGTFYVVVELASSTSTATTRAAIKQKQRTTKKMWTLTQFETFGALRLDDYLRYLVTTLALVWRSIAAFHKTAVNYSFTVSISDTSASSDLESGNVLDSRHPALLSCDGDDDEWVRNRGWSEASNSNSVVIDVGDEQEEESLHIVTAQQSPPTATPPLVEEIYYAFSNSECNVEAEEESDAGCCCEVEEEPPVLVHEDELKSLETKIKATVMALRTVCIPVLPLSQLSTLKTTRSTTSHANDDGSMRLLGPLVMPHIKPLVRHVQHPTWYKPEPEPVKPVAKQQPSKAGVKRHVNVSLVSTKPLTRLVVKPRPSTLTPPQSVRHMLTQAEKMMREVHELLAAGNAIMNNCNGGSSQQQLKTVRFSDVVQFIESELFEEDFFGEEAASRFYGPAEIESMSDEYFATASLPTCSC